jgi:hypothetical protein
VPPTVTLSSAFGLIAASPFRKSRSISVAPDSPTIAIGASTSQLRMNPSASGLSVCCAAGTIRLTNATSNEARMTSPSK